MRELVYCRRLLGEVSRKPSRRIDKYVDLFPTRFGCRGCIVWCFEVNDVVGSRHLVGAILDCDKYGAGA